MADEEYISYDEALQELQTNRGQLNQFIRNDRLEQHDVGGETRFNLRQVRELKAELDKEPTVMEEWEEEEPGEAAEPAPAEEVLAAAPAAATEDRFITYDEVLQELQTSRGQVNQFIRSGRLEQHDVEGETRFNLLQVKVLKGELQKEPTVMEEWEEEPAEAAPVAAVPSQEPATDVIEEGKQVAAERTTDVLEDNGAGTAERGTDIIEPEAGASQDEIALESVEVEGLEMEAPEEPKGPSDSALETELDLPATEADEEEDFFDFSGDLEDVDIELEAPPGAEAPAEEAEEVSDELGLEEDEGIVTEVLDLGPDDSELDEDDLLDEIMDIDEASVEEISTEDSSEITAEITTMEEPTYEESDLDELLAAEEEEEIELEEALVVGEEFEIPYAAPVEAPEAVGFLSVLMLLLAMAGLAVSGLLVMENSIKPEFGTNLTSWARFTKSEQAPAAEDAESDEAEEAEETEEEEEEYLQEAPLIDTAE